MKDYTAMRSMLIDLITDPYPLTCRWDRSFMQSDYDIELPYITLYDMEQCFPEYHTHRDEGLLHIDDVLRFIKRRKIKA